MKIAIIGASGDVGRTLILSLIQRGLIGALRSSSVGWKVRRSQFSGPLWFEIGYPGRSHGVSASHGGRPPSIRDRRGDCGDGRRHHISQGGGQETLPGIPPGSQCQDLSVLCFVHSKIGQIASFPHHHEPRGSRGQGLYQIFSERPGPGHGRSHGHDALSKGDRRGPRS